MAYRDIGIPELLTDLKRLADIRGVTEKGFMAILRAVSEEREQHAKVVEVLSAKEQKAVEEIHEHERVRQALASGETIPPIAPAVEAKPHDIAAALEGP